MSKPTMSTRHPRKAKERAKLILMKLLPSPLVDEVMSMHFSSPFSVKKRRLLRSRRKDSSISPFLPSVTPICSLSRGIVPTMGSWYGFYLGY